MLQQKGSSPSLDSSSKKTGREYETSNVINDNEKRTTNLTPSTARSDTVINVLLHKLINQKREVDGISIDEIARRTGLSNASISYYATTDRAPTQKSLEKLARYFGVSAAQLLEEDAQDIIKKIDDIQPQSAKGKTEQEKRLLDDFRRADRIDRLMILRFAELAAGGAKK